MPDAHRFDRITQDQLRAAGSLKWTLYPDTIGAFVAEMDFGTAPAVTAALQQSIEDGLLGYLPPAVSAAMSDACADWQRDAYGWTVDPGRVHPIPDVLKGLEVAIAHYRQRGGKLILPVPAYMPFLSLPPVIGQQIITVPMACSDGRYSFDTAAIDRAFDQGGELLILCNPYNPVGRVFTAAELAEVCAVVDAHHGRVFADEIHAPLIHPGRRHVPYASISETAAGHTLTATSASKAWNLPGLKGAQLIISNDADAEIWERVGFFSGHGAANAGVIAATAAYTSGGDWLAEVLDYLDGNRQLLAEAVAAELPMIRYAPPEGTYIGWLDCRDLALPDGMSAAEFFRQRAGVALTDGADCGTPGFVRMIFATPRPILDEAVGRMGAAVRTL